MKKDQKEMKVQVQGEIRGRKAVKENMELECEKEGAAFCLEGMSQ